MLEIKNLTVRYGGLKVFDGLSLTLEEGRIHALIGPSGCGKSTLLKVLCGIRPPDSGQLFHKNVPLSGAGPGSGSAASGPRIGYVPQNYGLLPWKTLRQNIFLPQRVGPQKGLPPAPEADEIINALGLDAILHRYPRQVSGGQQQRAALARAFIMRPDLLLMDEPFSALDAFTAAASRELFLRIWKKRRVTTLFITHSMAEAVEIGQKILLMGAGGRGLLACRDNDLAGQRQAECDLASDPSPLTCSDATAAARAELIASMSALLEQSSRLMPDQMSCPEPDSRERS